jgi:hypothetical protein
MKHLHEVATYDRFSFHDDKPVYFYYNNEITCKQKNGFEYSNEQAMVLYLRADAAAVRLMESKNDIFSFFAVEKWIVMTLVNYKLRLEERAYFAIDYIKLSRFIYKRNTIDESAREDPFLL